MRRTHRCAVATLAAIVLPALGGGPAHAGPPPGCWSPTGSCGFPVTPGRTYAIATSYQAATTVRADAFTYSAGAGWQKWFTGSPYGVSATWAPLETTTPVVPAGTERIGVAFPAGATVGDLSVTAARPAPDFPPYRPDLGGISGLVTNAYADRYPADAAAAHSPVWQVTSGSLFATAGAGDTGAIDDETPGPLSTPHTGSAVFRMTTRRPPRRPPTTASTSGCATVHRTSCTPPASPAATAWS